MIARMSHNLLLILFILYLFPLSIQGSDDDTERKPYIIYMGELPESTTSLEEEHYNLLVAAIGDEQKARESRIHSYGKSFNGFVASLLPHEAKKLSGQDSVVKVFPNARRKLHTTRTWDFLGMPQTVKRNTKIESDIIVGLLDTGIWIGCPSFNDIGMGPPPARWKGKCDKGANFTGCNNKVIGAKFFNLDKDNPGVGDLSPVDDDGHGSHTSSTAAGMAVKGASLYGVAKGTARGGVPSARIAMYKVCWGGGCSDMDLLAGFDNAIHDGVDIISVSIGGPSREFFDDTIAIGSFHAMKKGILTSCSAGNDGPYTATVENVAPWIMTVAASGIDREFKTLVTLGNGKEISGISINTFTPKKKMYPLTNGADAANITGGDSYGNISACDYGTLSEEKVKGKIVYCLGNGGQDYTIKQLNGSGTIMALDEKTDLAMTTLIPGTFVLSDVGIAIDKYINTTKNPTAVIHKTITTRTRAPFVASFSSRGPQLVNRNILKPDIAAPGLDILAAYSKLTTISGDPEDKRHDVFNIISGTSMACPHAAAAAAYVKSFHFDWSPAAIKSALMTTATPMKIKDINAELASGSGQINPVRAVHPGLIYDISLDSYIRFLCKTGYNSSTIALLFGSKTNYNCSKVGTARGSDGLNYPTMHMQLITADSNISAVFYRTVRNVGYGNSTYKAKIKSPAGLSVKVIPETLKFTRLHQKLSFKVVVKGPIMKKGVKVLSALLEWSDNKHSVRSPILVYNPIP